MSDACDGDATMCGEDAKARRVSRGNTFEQRNNVRRLRGDREKIEKRLRGHREDVDGTWTGNERTGLEAACTASEKNPWRQ